MYALHDNGRALFDSATTCTPMARFVYILAKNEHTDDPNGDPAGIHKGQDVRNATSKFR